MRIRLEDWDSIIMNNVEFAREVQVASDKFWMNTQLGYDKNGKVIRTDIPRKKPNNKMDLTFGNRKNKKEEE
jgi:hypothetical protein|tara:strand:- start:701 stop:916 length:216 start_codon:yes stop_codon:yes gene_type:complete